MERTAQGEQVRRLELADGEVVVAVFRPPVHHLRYQVLDEVGVRLGELMAYPLFVIATYQGTIHFLRARSRELQNLSQISLDQVKDLISLFEATREINSSLDLSTVLDGAAQSVAQAIEADQCAIALPEDGEDMSQLRLVSIYNPSRKGRGESVS